MSGAAGRAEATPGVGSRKNCAPLRWLRLSFPAAEKLRRTFRPRPLSRFFGAARLRMTICVELPAKPGEPTPGAGSGSPLTFYLSLFTFLLPTSLKNSRPAEPRFCGTECAGVGPKIRKAEYPKVRKCERPSAQKFGNSNGWNTEAPKRYFTIPAMRNVAATVRIA